MAIIGRAPTRGPNQGVGLALDPKAGLGLDQKADQDRNLAQSDHNHDLDLEADLDQIQDHDHPASLLRDLDQVPDHDQIVPEVEVLADPDLGQGKYCFELPKLQ